MLVNTKRRTAAVSKIDAAGSGFLRLVSDTAAVRSKLALIVHGGTVKQ
jgi:hypothetical protein